MAFADFVWDMQKFSYIVWESSMVYMQGYAK